MFSCPYKPYCGSEDLAVIVPSYSGVGKTKEININSTSNFKQEDQFLGESYCRYQVQFPMDATYGDFISIDISLLKYVELTMGISTEFVYNDDSDNKFS
jgi:hypothetical protein